MVVIRNRNCFDINRENYRKKRQFFKISNKIKINQKNNPHKGIAYTIQVALQKKLNLF